VPCPSSTKSDLCVHSHFMYQLKVKVVPSFRKKVGFPEVIFRPSPPHVAFSRTGAIQRLGDRSILRTCGYLHRILLLVILLPLEVRYSAESAVAIKSEFLAKRELRDRPPADSNPKSCDYESETLTSSHRVFCMYKLANINYRY